MVTTKNWPWVLSWHKSVTGTLGSPEPRGVGPAEAVPGVVLVSALSGVWGVPGLPVTRVDNTGLGCVVGDVVSTFRVGLLGDTGTVLTAGSSVGA